MHTRQALVASFSPAVRARTALAACNWLSWSAADQGSDERYDAPADRLAEDPHGERCRAPYFDSSGTPVLLVERRTSVELLDLGYASTEFGSLPELGLVRLQGELWPVAGNTYLNALRQFRLDHAECADCCGPLRSHLVGMRVVQVEVADPHDGAVTSVDLVDYVAAAPDPIITHSLSVRSHLNAMHADDLIRLASRILELPVEVVLAVSVDWIDAFGLELSVIDESGAGTHRLPFRTPLRAMDDLGGQLHAFLRHTGGWC